MKFNRIDLLKNRTSENIQKNMKFNRIDLLKNRTSENIQKTLFFNQKITLTSSFNPQKSLIFKHSIKNVVFNKGIGSLL